MSSWLTAYLCSTFYIKSLPNRLMWIHLVMCTVYNMWNVFEWCFSLYHCSVMVYENKDLVVIDLSTEVRTPYAHQRAGVIHNADLLLLHDSKPQELYTAITLFFSFIVVSMVIYYIKIKFVNIRIRININLEFCMS